MKWDLATATRMHDAGASWVLLGKKFGLDPHTVHERVDPVYREHRRRYVNGARRNKAPKAYVREVVSHRIDVIPTIPDDTRSLTGRFCGDPLTGRSALDRRHAAGE